MRLFVLQLRPIWSPREMVEHHDQLRRELASEGPEALRRHLAEGEHAVSG